MVSHAVPEVVAIARDYIGVEYRGQEPEILDEVSTEGKSFRIYKFDKGEAEITYDSTSDTVSEIDCLLYCEHRMEELSALPSISIEAARSRVRALLLLFAADFELDPAGSLFEGATGEYWRFVAYKKYKGYVDLSGATSILLNSKTGQLGLARFGDSHPPEIHEITMNKNDVANRAVLVLQTIFKDQITRDAVDVAIREPVVIKIGQEFDPKTAAFMESSVERFRLCFPVDTEIKGIGAIRLYVDANSGMVVKNKI